LRGRLGAWCGLMCAAAHEGAGRRARPPPLSPAPLPLLGVHAQQAPSASGLDTSARVVVGPGDSRHAPLVAFTLVCSVPPLVLPPCTACRRRPTKPLAPSSTLWGSSCARWRRGRRAPGPTLRACGWTRWPTRAPPSSIRCAALPCCGLCVRVCAAHMCVVVSGCRSKTNDGLGGGSSRQAVVSRSVLGAAPLRQAWLLLWLPVLG
jgi:hypothetical protein